MTFRFKAFDVVQSQSAMKIGTDAVLLGAWAPFSRGERILDIGSGTGVLALMMAQRFPDAHITAIDMDEAAANESRQNFEQIPWSNRLTRSYAIRPFILTDMPLILVRGVRPETPLIFVWSIFFQRQINSFLRKGSLPSSIHYLKKKTSCAPQPRISCFLKKS